MCGESRMHGVKRGKTRRLYQRVTYRYTEPRTMQNRFKSILKLCGIRNVNFHLLRHTYATVCIEKGFDPKTLSELLGHADAAITLNRYCHPSMQIKKDYVSRLSLTA